jgi:hypothetical protein
MPAPDATVKDPERTPFVIEHVVAVGTPGGLDTKVAPAQPVSVGLKPDPVTVTTVPWGPKLGVRVTSRGTTVIDADAETGCVSVTVIVYGPDHVAGTVKDEPVFTVRSVSILHVPTDGFGGGDEVVVQPATLTKLVPEMVMTVPTLTEVLGVKVIFGTTVRVFTALSPTVPVTCIAFVSTAAGLFGPLIMNEPVTTPSDMEHVGVPSITLAGAAIVQPTSAELNPEPETCIVSPPLPLLGESDIVGVITVKVADTAPCTTLESVSVTV